MIEKSNNRNKAIDISRGILIFLIVLGHTGFSFLWLFSLYYVQGFFFISGIFLKSKTDIIDFLLPKVKRIILPYFFFFSICALLCLITKRHSITEIHLYDPDSFDNGPMWFLIALFTGYIMVYLCSKIRKIGGGIYNAAVLAIFISCYYFGLSGYDDYTNWVKAGICLPFIIYGKDYLNIINRIGNHHKSILIQIVLFIIFLSILFGGFMYCGVNRVFMIRHLSIPNNPILFLILSYSGIFLIMFIGKVAECFPFLSNLFSFFGRASMYILCLHWPLLRLSERFIFGLNDLILILYSMGLCIITAFIGIILERLFPNMLKN